MRAIKFRAWELFAKRIFPHEECCEYTAQDLFNPGFFALMQFTGLFDKNGKEIYEGDIVTWSVNDVTRTAPVYYDESCACFWMGKEKTSGMLVLNDWLRGEYEVIGNIYEHPELREVKS